MTRMPDEKYVRLEITVLLQIFSHWQHSSFFLKPNNCKQQKPNDYKSKVYLEQKNYLHLIIDYKKAGGRDLKISCGARDVRCGAKRR